MLNEVFRYVYEKVDESGQKIPPSGVEDGIVILAVPDSI